MGTYLNHFLIQMGNIQTIDSFHIGSKIRPNMFRDHASILMEAKAKRKPVSATKVVGIGLVSVQQKKDNDLL